ncbi:hypothetical protein HDV00_005325 [Rhizophlyctis rosea]|nr:hypothetical protein HDV00_005325 [Rhizophlyctis rosea]
MKMQTPVRRTLCTLQSITTFNTILQFRTFLASARPPTRTLASRPLQPPSHPAKPQRSTTATPARQLRTRPPFNNTPTPHLQRFRAVITAPAVGPEDAWEAFLQIKDDVQTIRSLHGAHDLNRLCLLLRNTPDHQTKIHRMKTIVDTLYHAVGSVKVNNYVFLLQAIGERMTYKTAKTILEEMGARSVVPDKYIYSTILHYLLDDKENFLPMCTLIGRETVLSHPSLVAIVLKRSILHESLGAADKLFDGLLEMGVGLDQRSYSVLMQAHVEAGNLKRVFRLYECLMEAESQPDKYIFGTLITASLRSGDMARALAFFEEAKRRGQISSAAYQYLIHDFCHMNDMEQAEAFLIEATRSRVPLSSEVFRHVARRFLGKGDVAGAKRVEALRDFCKEQDLVTA